MIEKSRVLSLILVISAMLLLWSSLLGPRSCSATVAWSDDFNDGDFAGWTIEAGTFAITDNALEATGSGDFTWNFIRRTSDVAYGEWSFDVFAADAYQNHSYVYIISGVGDGLPNYRLCVWTGSYESIGITWSTGPGVTLLKQNTTHTVTIGEWVTGPAFVGAWHQIDVARDATGLFTISVDGTLRITVTNNELTTSTHFRFAAQANSIIDNIVVSNLPPTGPTTTPPGIPGFPLAALLIAIPLAIGITVLRRRMHRH